MIQGIKWYFQAGYENPKKLLQLKIHIHALWGLEVERVAEAASEWKISLRFHFQDGKNCTFWDCKHSVTSLPRIHAKQIQYLYANKS